MTSTFPLDAVLKRDRWVVLSALFAITALCWIYLVWMAAQMRGMNAGMDKPAGSMHAMTMIPSWTAGYFVMMFTMWAIMMVGMMIPSASPMILLFATFQRKRQRDAQPFVSTFSFLAGYLILWTVFSFAATLLQWMLDRAALLSPMMVSASPWLGAGILMVAGAFQLSPLKNACLRHCRSPIDFFMHEYRPGTIGALRMGMRHGLYCIGCCWILMALLFVGGVMNLVWIAVITGFVLLEKVAPFGYQLGRICGIAMVIAGAAMAFSALR